MAKGVNFVFGIPLFEALCNPKKGRHPEISGYP